MEEWIGFSFGVCVDFPFAGCVEFIWLIVEERREERREKRVEEDLSSQSSPRGDKREDEDLSSKSSGSDFLQNLHRSRSVALVHILFATASFWVLCTEA